MLKRAQIANIIRALCAYDIDVFHNHDKYRRVTDIDKSYNSIGRVIIHDFNSYGTNPIIDEHEFLIVVEGTTEANREIIIDAIKDLDTNSIYSNNYRKNKTYSISEQIDRISANVGTIRYIATGEHIKFCNNPKPIGFQGYDDREYGFIMFFRSKVPYEATISSATVSPYVVSIQDGDNAVDFYATVWTRLYGYDHVYSDESYDDNVHLDPEILDQFYADDPTDNFQHKAEVFATELNITGTWTENSVNTVTITTLIQALVNSTDFKGHSIVIRFQSNVDDSIYINSLYTGDPNPERAATLAISYTFSTEHPIRIKVEKGNIINEKTQEMRIRGYWA